MARPTKVTGDYASGIAIPFRGDSDGGVALAQGADYVNQLVLLTLKPNDSDNPFQDLDVTERAIFQNAADPEWKLETRQRVKKQMAQLERANLARLNKVVFGRGSDSGDLRVTIHYTNLETTQTGQAVRLVGRETSQNLRSL